MEKHQISKTIMTPGRMWLVTFGFQSVLVKKQDGRYVAGDLNKRYGIGETIFAATEAYFRSPV